MSGIDHIDSRRILPQILQLERYEYLQPQKYPEDAIYSEIENNCTRILESFDFNNHSAIQRYNVDHNPEILYTKVNKCNKQLDKLIKTTEIPLAKIMQDSLKSKSSLTSLRELPPLPESSENKHSLYSLPKSVTKSLSHCQSLNNLKMTEHNLMPKKQDNISKSDLSLHCSKILFENLCGNELIMDGGTAKQCDFEKVKNVSTYENFVIFILI